MKLTAKQRQILDGLISDGPQNGHKLFVLHGEGYTSRQGVAVTASSLHRMGLVGKTYTKFAGVIYSVTQEGRRA